MVNLVPIAVRASEPPTGRPPFGARMAQGLNWVPCDKGFSLARDWERGY